MSAKDLFDFLSTAGTLGFALLAIIAFLTERIVPRARLDEQIAEKKAALELARQSIASIDRLSDAVEARNRLEEARIRAEEREVDRRPPRP